MSIRGIALGSKLRGFRPMKSLSTAGENVTKCKWRIVMMTAVGGKNRETMSTMLNSGIDSNRIGNVDAGGAATGRFKMQFHT
ncbi:hypothetical protein V1478_012619 [Vespula squamosa]|uniref:Uncharacterized protein n=1 Tax=Vespula squamosa TaxID=30214 RepID=A0ABD2A8I6_VESSQ